MRPAWMTEASTAAPGMRLRSGVTLETAENEVAPQRPRKAQHMKACGRLGCPGLSPNPAGTCEACGWEFFAPRRRVPAPAAQRLAAQAATLARMLRAVSSHERLATLPFSPSSLSVAKPVLIARRLLEGVKGARRRSRFSLRDAVGLVRHQRDGTILHVPGDDEAVARYLARHAAIVRAVFEVRGVPGDAPLVKALEDFARERGIRTDTLLPLRRGASARSWDGPRLPGTRVVRDIMDGHLCRLDLVGCARGGGGAAAGGAMVDPLPGSPSAGAAPPRDVPAVPRTRRDGVASTGGAGAGRDLKASCGAAVRCRAPRTDGSGGREHVVGVVQCMWREDAGGDAGGEGARPGAGAGGRTMAQLRRLVRGEETVLRGAAASDEVFLTQDVVTVCLDLPTRDDMRLGERLPLRDEDSAERRGAAPPEVHLRDAAPPVATGSTPGRLRALHAFSGCGGLSAGLQASGAVETRWAIERDAPAAASFQANFPGAAVLRADCADVLRRICSATVGQDRRPDGDASDATPWHLLPRRGEVDLLCGGPPCQGYSPLNRHPGSECARRNNAATTLFLSLCEALDPTFVVMENVPALAAHAGGRTLGKVLRVFVELGYQVRFGVLPASAYGAPQRRERLVVLAARSGRARLPAWPAPRHAFRSGGLTLFRGQRDIACTAVTADAGLAAPFTVRDAIGDLPGAQGGDYEDGPRNAFQQLAREGSQRLRDHVSRSLAREALEDQLAEMGDDTSGDGDVAGLLDLVDDGDDGGSSGEAGRRADLDRFRVDPDAPAHTLTTDPRTSATVCRVVHYALDRILTVREYARLQGFPDTFRFCGTLAQCYRQVGNAVPVPLGPALLRGWPIDVALPGAHRCHVCRVVLSEAIDTVKFFFNQLNLQPPCPAVLKLLEAYKYDGKPPKTNRQAWALVTRFRKQLRGEI
ncbi:unnamed protein product [Pedinophyceae sp. YPF-701]|nr:unnamed protein product [Pedinophyceae sp. YPF-701]